jgi:hypothetical protein
LIVTGGNCSITGFDLHATEAFWTVTGDNVRSLESADIDFDGEPELLVGSDDYSIRTFRHEELIFDIKETSSITFLSKIEKAIFSFALSNGNIGVYNGSAKKWKMKVDNPCTSLKAVDLKIDGDFHVISGYNSGLVEVRRHLTGDITHSLNLESPIS